MKKIFLAILLIALSLPTFSQVKVSPGIRAGLNLSKITNSENVSRKAGFNGAFFVNIHLSRFYELQPEFTYSNQGFKRDSYNYINPYDTNVYTAQDLDVSSNYVGMAIVNKFFFVPNLGLHMLLGPGLEINVSDNLRNDSLTPVDLTFFVGLGYEFPIGLGFEARYKQGVVDVNANYYEYYDDGYYNDDYYYKNKLNSVFQFNVYYKFGW